MAKDLREEKGEDLLPTFLVEILSPPFPPKAFSPQDLLPSPP